MKILSGPIVACLVVGCGAGVDEGSFREKLSEKSSMASDPEGLSENEARLPSVDDTLIEPPVSKAYVSEAATAEATRLISFNGLPENTVINHYYASASFSKLLNGVDGGDVVVAPYSASNNAVTVAPHKAGTGPAFDNRAGTIHATFAALKDRVSINVLLENMPEGFGQTGIGYMKAYDSNKNLVGTAQTSVLGTWQTLTVRSPSASIKHVYFTVQRKDWGTYGNFDDLVFSPR